MSRDDRSGSGKSSRSGRDTPEGGEKSANHRKSRIEREMREVISIYLLGGFRGSLPGAAYVSRIIASSDLRQARVLVTFMNVEAPALRKDGVRELQEHAYEIQNEMNRKLRMRHCPRLTFAYDEGYEEALKVENILREISLKNKADAKAAGTAQPVAPADSGDED